HCITRKSRTDEVQGSECIGIPGNNRCWDQRREACEESMGVSMAIMHHLGPFSGKLHVRAPSHERREAPFQASFGVHNWSTCRRSR
ncbi:hypothetical protein S245_064736, partial [Arachis hypogaea]